MTESSLNTPLLELHDCENTSLSLSLTRMLELRQHRHSRIESSEHIDRIFHNVGRPALPWYYANPQQVSAMISNFSTSYNVVNISLVLPILKAAIPEASTASEDAVAAVASSLLAGMMLGQVLGGALGDVVGASRALKLVMILQIVASLGSAMVGSHLSRTNSTSSIYWHLSVWRFFLGIGAGGVYPLSAVLSTALAHDDHRSNESRHSHHSDESIASEEDENSSLHRVVLTFSMQGLGFITVPLVAVPLLYTVSHNLNLIWRIILGLGSLPGCFLMLWQWRTSNKRSRAAHIAVSLQEPSTYDIAVVAVTEERPRVATASDAGDNAVSDDENESVLDSLPDATNAISPRDDGRFSSQSELVPVQEQHVGWWASVRSEENLIRKLLGTAATWFLFDVLFYGNALFQPIVIEAAFGPRNQTNPVQLLQRTAVDSLWLTAIALPGYAVAGLVLGKKKSWCYCGVEQTPRFVMLQGFTMMAILYLFIGTAWNDLRRFPPLLVLLYSLTFFFANYGPNTTTFVLPSLVYSPECRSTFNGLSAAAGKLGALTGASLFEPVSDRIGDASVMLICALVAVMALVMTMFFVPNRSEIPQSQ